MTTTPQRSVVVNSFTNSLLDPDAEMLGPVADGGTIIANTAPGCWGPMLTPRLRGGHEVTQPVAVAGAKPGDGVAIRIKDITVTALATASGFDRSPAGYSLGDPYVAARCPHCDVVWPETHVDGIRAGAIKCDTCKNPVTPFEMVHGYTVVFDDTGEVGLTIGQQAAEKIAHEAEYYAALPDASVQHPVLTLAPADLPAVMVRMRPFLGQLGSTPSRVMPDSHNAGDFGAALIDALHDYAMTADELATHKTDAHMDIDAVREGAVLVVPVKVDGAGIYLGDMHAAQAMAKSPRTRWTSRAA